MNERPGSPTAGLSKLQTFTFAATCGALVANLYYAQTLIHLIGPEIGLSPGSGGAITTLTQLGYGIGLFLVAPLGDLLENRRVVLTSVGGTVLGSIAIAAASGPIMFLAASLFTGLCATGAQVLLPLAATLSRRERTGKVIGLIMSGLLVGIMLARPAASFSAHLFGWRSIFVASAALCGTLGIALWFTCPHRDPAHASAYLKVLSSVFENFRRRRALRMRSLYQGLLFMAFNLFWTAAPLELLSAFHFTQAKVALFALAGAAGALAAPLAGIAADRGLTRAATILAIATAAVSFVVSGFFVSSGLLIGFALSAVLVDAATQVNQITGQKLVYALSEEERARINSGYMTATFFLGATGSLIGTLVYRSGGWWAAADAGAGISLIALAIFLLADKGASDSG